MPARKQLLSTVLLVALALGAAATSGVTLEQDSLQPGDSDVCAVCGMFVARHPEWVAQVVYEDGSTEYFDGPKDLFKYLRYPQRYAREHRGLRIEAVFVTSYYDRTPIPARDAFYVLGSDVLGPMGAELVPHGSRDDAEEFMVDHRGHRILSYDDITVEVLESLS